MSSSWTSTRSAAIPPRQYHAIGTIAFPDADADDDVEMVATIVFAGGTETPFRAFCSIFSARDDVENDDDDYSTIDVAFCLDVSLLVDPPPEMEKEHLQCTATALDVFMMTMMILRLLLALVYY